MAFRDEVSKLMSEFTKRDIVNVVMTDKSNCFPRMYVTAGPGCPSSMVL